MDRFALDRKGYTTLALLVGVIACFVVIALWYRAYLVRQESHADTATLLAESVETPYSTLAGEPFSFAPFKGLIRLVTVWASWSPETAQDLPVLQTVAEQYGDVVTIAVNRKEPKERAQAYLNTLPAYPAVHYVIDETDAFYASIDGYAMPETVLFDAAGNVVWRTRGRLDESVVAAQIDQLHTQ